MTRCKGVCVNGRRCKKKTENEYCAIHDQRIVCGLCNKNNLVSERITLTNCNHVFCKKCISKNLFRKHTNGFSTEDLLYCPCCDTELCDESWQKVTSQMVDDRYVRRKILYKTYLCAQEYSLFELNKEYSEQELYLKKIKYDDLIVYFEKLNPTDWRKGNAQEIKRYIFSIGSGIRNIHLEKEIIEYVFHPQRIQRLGGMEYLDTL